MSSLRIAQELWAHALAYYVGSSLKKVLKKVGVPSGWLDNFINRGKDINVNNNDGRAWAFALVWWAGSAIKAFIPKIAGPIKVLSYIRT
ncbi:MAG: hypothetical protein E7575_01185 [Ruminococcaceae bacterium]|nr:hypothetical protein [Oscillospiraceae bacterium]